MNLMIYDLIFSMQRNSNILVQKKINKIEQDGNYNFPWWYYLNVGIWLSNSNKKDDIIYAKEYLNNAEKLYTPYINRSVWFLYIWAQQARNAILLNDLERAQQYISKIQLKDSVFPYIYQLEQQLSHLSQTE